MGRIHVLSTALIARIAAGECIERPASVVKELVENALDAGARQIDIEIVDGGRGLIRVVDDGTGMEADDLSLSVTQHATSKIRDDGDLFNIHSLGFRGEALASVGAVSRLQITSRTRESDVAHTIRVDAGEVSEPKPCSAPPGTAVEVHDLFYCVPARRKFLRTNQTEMGHITEQLARIALAQPGVGFSLKSGNRVTHALGATNDRRQRIADFYGPELGQVLLPIRREGSGVVVEGLVAPPAESRGSGKWEYVFVNGRYVRDRFVSHAVKEAYRSLIDPSRYPVVFLFITLDPEQVDVNVHPTKTEVRWRDSNYMHGQVLAALREKFLTSDLDHALQTPRDDEGVRERVREAMVDFFTRSHPEAGSAGPPAGYAGRAVAGGRVAERPAGGAGAPNRAGEVAETPVGAEDRGWQPPKTEDVVAPADEAGVPGVAPRAIQVHNAFLVVETEEGVMIIDQHALHERVLYEELRRRMAEKKLEAQRLLLPLVVRVPADRLEVLETHSPMLEQLGIELTVAGPQSVALQAFPTLLLDRVNYERFVRDLLDVLSQPGSRPNAETLIHEILDMMACKAAVKAGDPLTDEEIAALLRHREQAERSSHCPHGRPTTLRLTLKDLERQFHRR